MCGDFWTMRAFHSPARKVSPSIHDGARDMARDIAKPDEGRRSQAAQEKWRCRSHHLKRILRLDDCDYEAQTALATSSTSQPPLRIGGSPSSFRSLNRRLHEQATALALATHNQLRPNSTAVNSEFFNRFRPFRAFSRAEGRLESGCEGEERHATFQSDWGLTLCQLYRWPAVVPEGT
jgi:hypothetical protein